LRFESEKRQESFAGPVFRDCPELQGWDFFVLKLKKIYKTNNCLLSNCVVESRIVGNPMLKTSVDFTMDG
jgi:hypothetical protein